ncbi:50S ribosomal protein L25/general stress protein Ctc [Solemya elarraichensis gill symbiont]|uniref:Large ribosomal subunit protein bL25 n=1 Tax=Solemya elarraichensis gill symbiont TaxID=1918949 RepID=A0A1T2L6K5_9GAMM|nr:50S ribosomal protein L25/general stress protein Ctc [Solemya elarraichensis gill symbiont]OOZ40727.1 50S ribosomal protein L25/general stress protein Ctc [Solemya elarraichensis gill symbiont]
MAVDFNLNAESRSDTGKGASRRLRRTGMVPGIIYGSDKEPEMISVNHNELVLHLDQEAFYSHILTVTVDGKKQKVVLKDLQRHPAKPFVMHLDLLRVKSGEKLKMSVPLHFENEEIAPGVKAGGIASHHVTEVEVSCLPKDLPEYISVDVATLDIGDSVHLSEIKLPEGVEIPALALGEDHDQAIFAIVAARIEKEPEEAVEGGEEAAAEGDEEATEE